MKIINLFLSIGNDTLAKEKEELGNFIRELNDRYENADIYIKMNADDSKRKIKDNDFYMIIAENDISIESTDKFKEAFDSFKKNKKPKITSYIKKNNKENSERLTSFLNYLDQEIGHYYNVYENLDTIKLNILLTLRALGYIENEIEIDDDLISIDKLPMIFNNDNLNSLKKALKDTEEEYWKLKETIDESDEAFDRFSKVSEKRKEISSQIQKLQRDIIDVQSSFLKDASEGNLSKRQIYAKKCLDEGNLQEAIEALNFNEIKEQGDKLLELHKSQNEELELKLKELETNLQILEKEKEMSGKDESVVNEYNRVLEEYNKLKNEFI